MIYVDNGPAKILTIGHPAITPWSSLVEFRCHHLVQTLLDILY